jgi:hypothetical protein
MKVKAGVSTRQVKQAPKWITLPECLHNMNIDGAVAEVDNQGAVGVVCRSHDGVYLGASVLVSGGVTCPGCLDVVQGIQGKNLGQFIHILKEIRSMSRLRAVFHSVIRGATCMNMDVMSSSIPRLCG